MHGADSPAGLYFPWDRDDEVAQKVLEIEGADRYRTPFVLEGGAIHVDGQGTCLTTEECLLNPNRNPAMGRADIEEMLRRYLGVSTVIWLGAGVYLDETGGHIDELACFTSPGNVALTWTDDRGDPAIRNLGGCLPALEERPRRARTRTCHSQDPSARAVVHDGRGGIRSRSARGGPARAGPAIGCLPHISISMSPTDAS